MLPPKGPWRGGKIEMWQTDNHFGQNLNGAFPKNRTPAFSVGVPVGSKKLVYSSWSLPSHFITLTESRNPHSLVTRQKMCVSEQC